MCFGKRDIRIMETLWHMIKAAFHGTELLIAECFFVLFLLLLCQFLLAFKVSPCWQCLDVINRIKKEKKEERKKERKREREREREKRIPTAISLSKSILYLSA
jgi:hypothetical protein